MTCKACTDAMTAPRAAEFTCGCMSCDARALAVTGAHDEAKARGCMTVGYRNVLETMFGANWVEGAALVKHWGALCDRAKQQSTTATQLTPARVLGRVIPP